MLIIELMKIELSLEGCSSLKEKRSRTRGIRDRFGKQPNVAVIESDYQESLRRAQWVFICLSTNKKIVDQTYASIEEGLSVGWDFTITDILREAL